MEPHLEHLQRWSVLQEKLENYLRGRVAAGWLADRLFVLLSTLLDADVAKHTTWKAADLDGQIAREKMKICQPTTG